MHTELVIGPSPSELSSKAAFLIFPIAHQYDMRAMLIYCDKAIDGGLELWPLSPIPSSKVSSFSGLVQWLALADAQQCDPVVRRCLSQLNQQLHGPLGTLYGVLASSHLRKLMDGLRPDTKTDLMSMMAGL